MGFHRKPQPAALDRAAITAAVTQLLPELLAPADPFCLDDPCINPEGHQPIASCRDHVCPHCGKVFWQ